MNIHATSIALAGSGLLIEGPSGSGKTGLALAAIEKFQDQNHFAAMVADDQTLLEIANGKLIATCPPTLIGLAELRGFGIVKTNSTASVVIDAVIRLVDETQIERIPEPKFAILMGVQLPVFELPARQIAVALPILAEIVESRRF